MVLARVGRRILRFIYEYSILIIILVFGLYIWLNVFDLAVADFMESDVWRFRGSWLGAGETDIFGYTVVFQFEGYTDHSYYYVHWGNNFLRGVAPYSGEFGYINLDGYINENGAYMFPPLTAYVYALGVAIVSEGWGIGLILTVFGFITVFPVYGLGKELANNRHVGEAAAFTYLLNPNVLFHGAFIWMNPAPFIFFFFSGFYMLVTNRKHTGTLLIVAAALFKQSAWFLGIPLVVYLLIKPSVKDECPKEEHGPQDSEDTPSIIDRFVTDLKKLGDKVDIRGFIISTIIVACFVLAIVLPFLLVNGYMLQYWGLAAGSWPLESLTELPNYGVPIRLQILPVAAGLPWLAEIVDLLVYFGFLLALGVFLFMGLMFLEPKYKGHMRFYFRRILFLTFLMMLCVHLTGPRGVFKYYFTLFAPFFSIFASTKMVTSEEETVPFSFSMLWIPLFLVLTYLVPSRNVYLFAVILILLGYVMASKVGKFWLILSTPGRFIRSKAGPKMQPITSRLRDSKSKFESVIYPERTETPVEVVTHQ
ncbi:MAG: hypothetical protein ACTSUB_05850 [Candidatus Thorarchaeota archaeon]